MDSRTDIFDNLWIRRFSAFTNFLSLGQRDQLQRQLARLHEERGSEIDDAASDERGRVRAAPRSKWGGEKEATRV